MTSFLDPLLRGNVQNCRLVNARTGRPVADTLLTAFDSRTRRTGLLKHESLPEGTALILAPTSAIHTFFMQFPIDVVFVAKNGLVLKVRSAMPPWRIAGALRGYAVIELRSGALTKSDTRSDDTLVVG